METISIYGQNRFEAHSCTRTACRGVIIRDAQILLTYEENTDQWFIPGGGLEGNETWEDCCARELAEETGCSVQVGNQFLTIHEYYEEWLYISHYFLCEASGFTERRLTDREAEAGLQPRWLPLQEAIQLFSKHRQYASESEMKRGAYLREYTALTHLPQA